MPILNRRKNGGGGTMTPTEILTALRTVDGSGSNLDADQLDSHSSEYFAPIHDTPLTGTTYTDFLNVNSDLAILGNLELYDIVSDNLKTINIQSHAFAFSAPLLVTGAVTASGFIGSGAQLTGIPESAVTNLSTDLTNVNNAVIAAAGNIVDANVYMLSGAGTSVSPWLLDAAAIDGLASGTTLRFRAGKHYGVTRTSGLHILHGTYRITFDGNGATLWNMSGAEAQCLISVGIWNTDGTPTPTDDQVAIGVTIKNLVLDGGVNGMTKGLRINSCHFCLYQNLDIRNYKKFGVLNLGGLQSDFDRISCNNDQTGSTFVRYFTPETAIQISGAPSTTGIWTPSTMTLRHCEGKNHSKDGLRLFDAFNTRIDSSAFEGAIQGPVYSPADGATSTPPYVGDGSWLDQEIYTRGNKGAGVYIGSGMVGTILTNVDCEDSAHYPSTLESNMGIVVDTGARDTTIINCYSFNSMICINNGASQTTVIGANQAFRLNGQGVKLIGGPYTGPALLKGPNLKNFYHQVGDYANFLFDKMPPTEVGGFIVGYDPYTNGGPVETQTYVCLFNKLVSGGGYPNYALMQEAGGRTRISGSEIWIGTSDAVGLTFGPNLMTITGGFNFALDTGTGTKFGTSTSQKLAFFNATPIAQAANTTDLRTLIINFGFLASGGATPLNLNGGSLTAAGVNVSGDITHAGNKIDKTVTLTDGATTTFDLSLGDMGSWTIGGNRTLAVSNGHSGSFVLRITQDGTGSRVITWPASFKFSGGSTLSTTAGAVDMVAFVSVDGGTTYLATLTTGHA